MTRKAFLKQYMVRFSVVLALLCLIFYTVYHVFSGSADSLMTTPVRQMTDRQLIGGKAYLFRNEQVIGSSSEGLVNDLVPAGTKVSAKTPLTEIWDTGSSSLAQDQLTLDRVNRLIEVLELCMKAGNSSVSLAEGYRDTASKTFFGLQQALSKGEWAEVEALEYELLTALNQYAVVTGDRLSVKATLEHLLGVKQSLLVGEKTVVESTDQSGYFYNRSYVDGYESILTPQALAELTPERFAALIATAPNRESTAVGKLAYGYTWSLVIEFGTAERALLEQGEDYRFTFPENRGRELDMTCVRLIAKDDGGVIAVFESMEIPTDFVYYRIQQVQIASGSCEGYYVPESALREQGGVTGVYIFKDSMVHFRRIDVLYEGDGYYIVAENTQGDDEYLSLYDILITSGKNLYEGRVYQ